MIKRSLKPLLTGLCVTIILVLVMLKVTMNFQILLFLGAALFFLGGYLNNEARNHFLITTVYIDIFYSGLFIFIVLKELPELWYFVPIFIVSTLLGLKLNSNKLKIGISSILLTMVMLYMAAILIPDDLHNSLTKERFDQLPEFTIQDMNGNSTESKSLAGKVVVLDFFGTWCRPCIQELKELEKIKNTFNENDVVFYIINTDQGGDTPEKFETFINKNNYTFNFAYDHNSETFKLIKMYHFGLPTLLIIDKDQNIRLQHVGYNPAEINFKEHIIETINGLL